MSLFELANKNKELHPDVFERLYGHLVTEEFRKVYDADKVEAIVNNYLDDPTNEKYIAEMRAMQDYRKQCKANAKAKLGVEL